MSVRLPPDKLYIFVVDTDQYSGNFEREMCAAVTGKVGECEVGNELAIKYCKENNIGDDDEYNEHVILMPDDHGSMRPCSIWTTPGWVNNGNGKHLRDNTSQAKGLKTKYPAYNSVAIFMDRKPTPSEIEDMKVRAFAFAMAQTNSRKINIEGFRLITRITTETVTNWN